jgi:hypothetical protein
MLFPFKARHNGIERGSDQMDHERGAYFGRLKSESKYSFPFFKNALRIKK